VTGDIFLNTAGAWVDVVAAMTRARLPVQPMCRVQHFWHCAHAIEAMPLVKDESGAFFRPEGDGFVGGRPSWDVEPGFIWEIDRGYFANYFEDTVWQLIANMVPKFETIKLQRSWGGHYAQNLFDAVGRALAELVLDGDFQTLDLSRMGFQRVLDDTPYAEAGIT
jgi:glycine/D-amino acid oxidase-like deaminating enzyme